MFALSFRAEPLQKKKKVDPKKDQAAKERLKKRIRRLEKASQELVPIEDFITPVKFLNKARYGPSRVEVFRAKEFCDLQEVPSALHTCNGKGS